MAEAPVTYRDYYHRWVGAFKLDLLRLGREQMIGAALAILILAFQWWYGLIPQDHGWQAIKSLGWPYLILLAGLLLVSAIRAPVSVDREHSANISKLTSENVRLQGAVSEGAERVKRLSEQVDDLKKPKRTASQEKNYQAIKDIFDKYGDDDKTVLRHLRRHGKMIETAMSRLSPLPTEFSRERAMEVLAKLEADHIVTPERRHNMGGFEYTWQIAPGAVSTLDELL